MSLELRAITPDESSAFRRAIRAGFLHADTVEDDQWSRDTCEPWDRCLATFDGPEIVATLQSFPLELTMPGGTYLPVGGVSAVTSQATHRRRGLLTTMITRDLAESSDRGEVADILIAAEYPIYGRFGYGPAVSSTSWQFDVRTARFVEAGEGDVQFVDNAAYRKEAPAVFARVRAMRPGMISRNDLDWDVYADLRRAPEDKPWEGFRVVCTGEGGGVDGYASYTIKRDWNEMRPNGRVEVAELLATTPRAEARLWRFLAEVDWITEIKAGDRPTDELLPWLLADARMAKQVAHNDFIWVRPLDVPGLLVARAYTATGTVTLEVVDTLGFAAGRFELDASPAGATCVPTTAAADVTVPVAALGAASLGGTSLRTMWRSGWLDEQTPGAVDRLATLLAGPVPPWCNTWF